MDEKQKWIDAIKNNPPEVIAEIIVADTNTIRNQKKIIEELKKGGKNETIRRGKKKKGSL